jgi:hypothetical protein
VDATEFGRNAAGAVLTQIARYSPILNQSTVLSNEGFICAITYRINGSLALLYQASGIMNEIASCPVLKKDGSPCGCRLNQDGEYTHFIGCKSHGFHLRPHNCMEDTLLATFQDALRRRIIGTDAFTCLNDDKRPRVVGNLRTSIPCTLGEYDEQSNTFKQGNQADGLTIYNGHLEHHGNSLKIFYELIPFSGEVSTLVKNDHPIGSVRIGWPFLPIIQPPPMDDTILFDKIGHHAQSVRYSATSRMFFLSKKELH